MSILDVPLLNYMTPNNTVIDDSISNTFSFMFSGYELRGMDFTLMFKQGSGFWTSVGVYNVSLLGDYPAYNGQICSFNMPAHFVRNSVVTPSGSMLGSEIGWSVSLYGGNYVLSAYNASAYTVNKHNLFETGDMIRIEPTGTIAYVYAYGSNLIRLYQTLQRALIGSTVDDLKQYGGSTIQPTRNSDICPFRAFDIYPIYVTTTLIEKQYSPIRITSAIPPSYQQYPIFFKWKGYLMNDSKKDLAETDWIYNANIGSIPFYNYPYVNGHYYYVKFIAYDKYGREYQTEARIRALMNSSPQTFFGYAEFQCEYNRAYLEWTYSLTTPVSYFLIFKSGTNNQNSIFIGRFSSDTNSLYDYIGFIDNDAWLYEVQAYDVNNNYLGANNGGVVVNAKRVNGYYLVNPSDNISYYINAELSGGELNQSMNYVQNDNNNTYPAYNVGELNYLKSSLSGIVKKLPNKDYMTNLSYDEIKEFEDFIYDPSKEKILQTKNNEFFNVFAYDFTVTPLNIKVDNQPVLINFNYNVTNIIDARMKS